MPTTVLCYFLPPNQGNDILMSSSLSSQEKQKTFPIDQRPSLRHLFATSHLHLTSLWWKMTVTLGATIPTYLPSKLGLHPFYSIRTCLPCLLLDYEIKPNMKTMTTPVGCSKGGELIKNALVDESFKKGRRWWYFYTHILRRVGMKHPK